MFLHEVSRRACAAGGLSVSDSAYQDSVIRTFGHVCLYCDRNLEHDRAAVEHLNGMNRFQVGLHVPGNVALSCRRCNNEKRRDDLNPVLSPNSSGWESFLHHDGTTCAEICKHVSIGRGFIRTQRNEQSLCDAPGRGSPASRRRIVGFWLGRRTHNRRFKRKLRGSIVRANLLHPMKSRNSLKNLNSIFRVSMMR